MIGRYVKITRAAEDTFWYLGVREGQTGLVLRHMYPGSIFCEVWVSGTHSTDSFPLSARSEFVIL